MAETGNRGFGATAEQQHTGHNRGHNPSGGSSGRGSKAEESQGVMGSAMEGAQHLASSVASAAGQAWDTTRDVAQKAASTVANTAEDVWDTTTGFMRRYPFATLAIGFGLGFLVCMALDSRRS
jgi:ElaB/YqjD/DUF883 family membrane-anchored ribosome-binding protein